MAKMTEEKKKRSKPTPNVRGQFISTMKEIDPEFKKAADTIKDISDKYPKLSDAPQDELNASMKPILNMAEQMALFLERRYNFKMDGILNEKNDKK